MIFNILNFFVVKVYYPNLKSLTNRNFSRISILSLTLADTTIDET